MSDQSLSLFAVMDHYLDLLLAWVVPWAETRNLAIAVSSASLILVIAYLGYDMLAVFVPKFRQWEQK